MLYEFSNERRDGVAFRVDGGERCLSNALSRADVGHLVGDEIGRREEAVLQVVDAEGRGLAIGDGAEMTGELHPAFVSFVERGPELVAGDVHVRLERRGAG